MRTMLGNISRQINISTQNICHEPYSILLEMKCEIMTRKMFSAHLPSLSSYKNCFSFGPGWTRLTMGWTAFIRFRHCEAWDGDGASQGRGGDFLYFVI